MERAVAVMKQSVPENRSDGKPPPLVGAVLVKENGTIETASRCELRDGDHAEYTLLERKSRHCRLDGARLFATLEPCAPGARSERKLSCAERIVIARIKEVWVGIEDPDPKVDRKGIKYLQDHGVEVHLFDRDLQEEIRAANKEFIEQAEARALAAAQEPTPIVLSELEEALPAASTDEFSVEALDQYRRSLKVTEPISSDAFNRRLLAQGLVEHAGNQLVPTRSGLVLFGREPRDRIRQAGLLGTMHLEDGTEETRDFDGPAVLVPEQVLEWIRNKLPTPIDRTRANRNDATNAFFMLVREGVVNALVHRDYSIAGAKCQVRVTANNVVISSPGQPVSPITVEQLQSFNAPMLSRNPVLHYVFSKIGLAEERGLGLKSMRTEAKRVGLPTPTYRWRDPYIELTLYRSAKAAAHATDKKLLDSMTNAERKGWAWLAARDGVTTAEYAKEVGVSERSAVRHLQHFAELGLVRRIGRGPSTRYEVVRP